MARTAIVLAGDYIKSLVEERGTIFLLKPREVSDFPFGRCGLRPEKTSMIVHVCGGK
jgi:hypothetical protein